MNKGSVAKPAGGFPLTNFLVALIRMTPEQRARASAEKAAERYGLPVGWTRHYINHWRTIGNE